MLRTTLTCVRNFIPPFVGKTGRMALSTKVADRYPKFETLQLSRMYDSVYKVYLNRPDKRNAMNSIMWKEIGDCFRKIADDEDCRCVILSGNGKDFCSGIDIFDFKLTFEDIAEEPDIGRRAIKIKSLISSYQSSLSAIENCRKPVIAAVHGHCIGGGVDIIAAADIRYCTSDANFQIKEVDLGLAPDTGTIQRLGKAVGNASLFREMVLSGNEFGSTIAMQLGMMSRILPDLSIMMQAVESLAAVIASKSPVAVQTAKESLIYSRDHSVAESLDHIANWNMAMLQSEDVPKAMLAMMQKVKPDFAKL